MDVLKIGPRTPISIFLGAMAFAVGALFVVALWHATSGPTWIGWPLAAVGIAILAASRTIEIDPHRRLVRVRRRWLLLSSIDERSFDAFTGVSVARTPGTTPSYCVQLLAEQPISLPTQGRDPKGARARARQIAGLLGVAIDDEKRTVSSVPMI